MSGALVRRSLTILGAGLVAAFVGGCATTVSVVNEDADLNSYEGEVYTPVLDQDRDPRGVYPRVVAGLREIGFQVTEVPDGSGVTGNQGTGFAISQEGLLVTSGHLFSAEEKQATVWITGQRYEATVEKMSEDPDLALLRLVKPPEAGLTPLTLEAEPAYRMGADIFTIGFPLTDVLGAQPRLNKGLVSASVGLKDDPKYIQVSVEIQPGNSGSPIFNDDGKVIGVVEASLNAAEMMAATGGAAPQNVNFALKVGHVREFLEGTGWVEQPRAEATQPGKEPDFEAISQSVAQVRSGLVSDELIKSKKLFCFIRYKSLWDMFYRFSEFTLIFLDYDTREIVLIASQPSEDVLSPEDVTIRRVLEEVRQKFFPGGVGGAQATSFTPSGKPAPIPNPTPAEEVAPTDGASQ